MKFSEQDILNHRGTVVIFCPHVEPNKSSYKPVQDVAEFVKRAFDPKSAFRPVGRVEGRQMLVCMLPG
jgi:hypothetical protein